MEERKLKLIFKYKEDLLNYGQEKLYNEFINIIKDVERKYVINAHGIDKDLYLLLGFEDNEKLKENLSKISVCDLEPYIKTFTENVFKSLEDERSFISRCLKNTWDDVYKNLEIKFDLRKIEFDNGISTGEKHDLELSIMGMSKYNGCGSGDGFRFDVINLENLKKITNEVKKLNIPVSVKNMYIDYFYGESEDNFDLNIVKDWVAEGIVESIDNYIYEHQEKYKQYKSLYKQGVKEELIDFIETNKWMGSISDAIEISYGLSKASSYDVIINHVKCKEGEYYTDENKIEIKFLGEVIKSISKSSYTVYEIN